MLHCLVYTRTQAINGSLLSDGIEVNGHAGWRYGVRHLRQIYEKPYEQLCEDYFGPDEIAYNLVPAVHADLKRYGDAPLQLLFRIAHHFEAWPQEVIWRSSIDFTLISRMIDGLARQIGACHSKRAMELAREACKMHLRTFQAGALVENHRQTLVFCYLTRMYDAEFSECVPMGYHHCSIGHDTFAERLNGVRPYVLESLSAIARQVARRSSTSRLRIPRPARTSIEADTDLLSVSWGYHHEV